MEQPALPTEVILTQSKQTLGRIELDWTPEPGSYVDFEGQTYAVLERRHQYNLRSGKYCLNKISIYVQTAQRPDEMTLIDGRWVIGDATCLYNARSAMIRCAVNTAGPCEGCRHYVST
jgi:hypothetical protein